MPVLTELRGRVVGRARGAARRAGGKALHAVADWCQHLVEEIAVTADHMTEDGPLNAPPAPAEVVAERLAEPREVRAKPVAAGRHVGDVGRQLP